MRTTQPLKWNVAISLIDDLIMDKEYRAALMVTLGIFTGFRISDLLRIKKSQLLATPIILKEKKTGKVRAVKLSPYAIRTIEKCLDNIIFKPSQTSLFVSSRGSTAGQPLTVDGANYLIKRIFDKYGIKAENDSSHTLRKTFCRQQVDVLWKRLGDFHLALYIVGKNMNHADVYTTMDYVGYTHEYSDYAYKNMEL